MKLTWTYRIVLATVLTIASWLCSPSANAHAFENDDIEKFYKLSPEEQCRIISSYSQQGKVDSAMQYANLQTNRFLEKENLTKEESSACCWALNYIGLVYTRNYYNYQLGTTYLLKAKQIAHKYGHQWQYANAVTTMSILEATRNNLDNNYAYSPELIGFFKNSFKALHNNYSTPAEAANVNSLIGNMVSLAIKYDKTDDIENEVNEYSRLNIVHSINSSFAQTFCRIYENYQKGKYTEALKLLEPSSIDYHELNENDSISHKQVENLVKYYLLMKCGRMKDAEAQLLRLEKKNRADNKTFELLEVLNMLQRHYELQGNEALAHKYELLYFTTKDEFINKSRLAKMDEAKLNIELEQTRNQVREMATRQRIQTIVLWGVVILSILVLAILTIIYINSKRNHKKDVLLYQKQIALLRDSKEQKPEPQTHNNDEAPTAEQLEMIGKIRSVMETSPDIYNEGFTVTQLAALVGVHEKNVSHLINNVMHSKFNTILNEYRIKEACKRLIDTENYGHLTIEGIAQSLGYKSRANFVNIFKDIVGLTPSAFQKMSKKD
ncbi:MAG: helix-turn-helix transcriptional regulator [Bacteroidales bacterium]|nr:helix-turn-helix transcriptional regulator [Candidatus Sodaliphilus aphodohippi]